MLAGTGNGKRYIFIRAAAVLFVLLEMLFITGCRGKSDYDETLIRILKKGKIESDIVEPFGENYYDEAELTEMLNESAREYNEKAGEKDCVSIEDIRVAKDIARVVIVYRDSSDYAEFNKVDFFYGTVSEALSNGFDLNMTMLSLEDGRKKGFAELSGIADSHIVILSEPILVETNSDIKYVSANVEYLDETHARMSSESSGLACIVLEK
ncbi:MAG: hypothetical protein K5770_05395 [Lachnospiraceae bacterium]|nr:hypothetical protein [Lachnospiraceae bacterium]